MQIIFTIQPVRTILQIFRRLPVTLLAVLVLALPIGLPSIAAAAPSTVTLTVTVRDGNVGKQNAVQVTDLSNNVLGVCQQSTAAKKTTCDVQVPVNKSVVVAAQAAPGEAFQWFTGSGCASAPGPVCHIAIGTSNQSVKARFDTALLGPTITTAKPLVYAGSPTLSLAGIGYSGYDLVQVNGTGFKANAPAKLTDDGKTVATGTTDGSGNVALQYTAASEPGIYRDLVVKVGNKTAQTDVYNTLVWAWGEGDQGSGSIFFVVNETDMDANEVENYVQFNGNTPVPIDFSDGSATQGYAQINTPHYACAAGSSATLRIYGARGTGAQRYTYDFSFPITC